MNSYKFLQGKLKCPFSEKPSGQQSQSAKIGQAKQSPNSNDFPDIENLTREERLALYKVKLAEYKDAREERRKQGSTALFEHEHQFVDNTDHFNGSTVTRELDKMHASGTTLKGPVIAEFNATHSGNHGPITINTDFSEHIHHGTARIFNADGTFNQKNWDALVTFVKEKQGPNETDLIRESTLTAFVKYINKRDGFDEHNGRRHVLTTLLQDAAGSGARTQLFDLLTCGYKLKKHLFFTTKERYMKMEDLELFYRDSPAVFLKASCGLLPLHDLLPDNSLHDDLAATNESANLNSVRM